MAHIGLTVLISYRELNIQKGREIYSSSSALRMIKRLLKLTLMATPDFAGL